MKRRYGKKKRFGGRPKRRSARPSGKRSLRKRIGIRM